MNAPLHVILPEWQEPDTFDPWQDAHMRYVFADLPKLKKPVQDLLCLSPYIKDEAVKDALDNLFQACKTEFEE